jgi:hypothetical protein
VFNACAGNNAYCGGTLTYTLQLRSLSECGGQTLSSTECWPLPLYRAGMLGPAARRAQYACACACASSELATKSTEALPVNSPCAPDSPPVVLLCCILAANTVCECQVSGRCQQSWRGVVWYGVMTHGIVCDGSIGVWYTNMHCVADPAITYPLITSPACAMPSCTAQGGLADYSALMLASLVLLTATGPVSHTRCTSTSHTSRTHVHWCGNCTTARAA